jgi:hypothetical protein
MAFAPKQIYYIQSKLPANYLYHHSYYASLKRIAQEWAIRAAAGKQAVSLTTDAGRFLSPMPMLSMITIDGVVRLPYTEELRAVAIPAMYKTTNTTTVGRAKNKGFTVYDEQSLPLEYKYVLRYVVHHEMFINENEYAVMAPHLNLTTGSEIFVHPGKLKRLKASVGTFTVPIRSLKELAEEIERGVK